MSSKKWWFAIMIAIASFAAFVIVAITPPKYTARILIAPSQSGDLGGVQLGQIQQLAGLFGGSATPGAISISELSAVIQSRRTAENLIRESDVLQKLFPERWNAKGEYWMPQPGFAAALQRVIYTNLMGIELPSPGPDSLVKHIMEKVTILPSKNNPGLYEIKYEARDPEFALNFLKSIVDVSQQTLLQRYKEANAAGLTFANQQLEQNKVQEVRGAILSLVVAEMRKGISLASGRLDTTRVVIPPEVDYIPKRPSLIVSLIMLNLVGALSLLLFLIVTRRMKS